jgi:glycosyltransferase involved in cell wall biosynthesis
MVQVLSRPRLTRAAPPDRPKLVYLVTEDWYFWSHRLPMARAARDAGFEVGVATRVAEHADRIRGEGFALHPLDWRRRSLDQFEAVRAVRDIAALYRRERPDIVHHVALKATVFGSLAARLAGVPGVVNGLTGLGYVFTSRAPKAQLLRMAIVPALGRLLDRPGSALILQNEDDRALLMGLGLVSPGRVEIVRGSGIDIDRYRERPEPEGPVTAAYVGRMLEDKGVHVLVEALRRLRARGARLDLRLVGTPDPENPTSIPEATLRRWCDEIPGLEWLGHRDDVREVWASSHLAVLPSRREGLPKSLLEAAACGRALVATDVPGCREIARPGLNALLVPPDDPAALADALATLAEDAALRRRFARESRRMVESDLASGPVGERTVALYRRVLAEGRAP